LLWDLPMLGVTRDGFTQAFTSQRAQELLKPMLRQAQELTGAERVTAWLVDGTRMWSIASTDIGNALIEIPYGIGLAGKAASTGNEVLVEDAYNDPRFNKELDQALGYRTRSVVCVPLKRRQQVPEANGGAAASQPSVPTASGEGPATTVLQLLNKIGEDRKHKPFTTEDVLKVRESLEVPFIDACDLIALTADRRQSFIDAVHENAETLRSPSMRMSR